jgi:hypothetical protein
VIVNALPAVADAGAVMKRLLAPAGLIVVGLDWVLNKAGAVNRRMIVSALLS